MATAIIMSFMSKVSQTRAVTQAPRSRSLLVPALLAVAILIALRLPGAWGQGRFQDEEATVFLAFAWHFPGEALLRPFGGYLNIAANGITLALAQAIRGGLISLEHAPYVTMLAGLAAQLVPAAIIVTSHSRWLADLCTRWVAVLLLVLMPTTEEVFLNVMHIQFHLALGVALILGLDGGRGRGRAIAEGVVLVLAPLCGPAAIVLLPLFALRALVERDGRRWRQLALLGAGAAIQLLFFYHTSTLRGVPFDPVNLAAAMFIRLLALPFGGINGANLFGAAAATALVNGGPVLLLLGGVSVVTFALLLKTTLQARDEAFWLFAAAMCVAGVSLGFGIATGTTYSPFFVGAGPRYNYLPLVLLGLCLLCLAVRSDAVARRTPRLLVLLMLFVGAVHYLRPDEDYARGPNWRQEVAAWKADPNHPLAVWPAPYAADLSNRGIRCSQTAKVNVSWTAPRYCPEGWVTSFIKGSDPASAEPRRPALPSVPNPE